MKYFYTSIAILAIFAIGFATGRATYQPKPSADLNQDGIVDTYDLSLLLNQFTKK